jgi:hypothetical protein
MKSALVLEASTLKHQPVGWGWVGGMLDVSSCFWMHPSLCVHGMYAPASFCFAAAGALCLTRILVHFVMTRDPFVSASGEQPVTGHVAHVHAVFCGHQE